jgi:hypothetical protein
MQGFNPGPPPSGLRAVGWNRWAAISLAVGAVLIAVGIGAGAYQAGVAHGLALQIPAGTAPPELPPYAYYGWYGWHRPWGFGFFGPFFFILFWVFLMRAFWWGGYRRRWYYRHWDEMPSRFDEWHRRAHEQMKPDASSPTHL